jgi:hypothetical protein
VFDNFYQLVVPFIDKRIMMLAKKNNKEKLRKASFNYINDRLVVMAMRKHWNQGEFKPGKKNKLGLRSHAWQALGVLSCYLDKES